MKITLALSALVAMAATFVSAAPAPAHPPASSRSSLDPLEGLVPKLPYPKHVPPHIIFDRTNRTSMLNGTRGSGLAGAAASCRSITLTWWSLNLDGDDKQRQIHSFKLEVSGTTPPFEPEYTDQDWSDPSNDYFLRQWGVQHHYYVEHRNYAGTSPEYVFLVVKGVGYLYKTPNKRFDRYIWSDWWKRWGQSTNSLYWDCIDWPY
ncbi:hypothetical protein BGZ47_008875 [Haplosporangium gracile]|nr:hypothetical protein BGZ47_008875 [Haplosporangium gracile]